MIVDDEPLARRGLEQLLANHDDCLIVAACRGGRDMARALPTVRPDVVFLDIQMPRHDGFEVLQLLGSNANFRVVFVTAHDEYAVRAFEEQAIDYLLKPVSQERFDRALARVRERIRAERAVELSQRLLQLAGAPVAPRSGERPGAGSASLVVPTGSGDRVLATGEIDWIQAMDYCSAVHANGRRHIIRESLASLERRLDNASFVRVHRSAIVRLDHVRELRTVPSGRTTLILRDGTRLPVSRRRSARVSAMIRQR